MTSYDVARKLVQDLGGNPSNTAIVRAVAIWLALESGNNILGNNPWNLRPGSDLGNVCTKGTDKSNFTVFCTIDDGIQGTANRLKTNDSRGYYAIANSVSRGDVTGFFRALVASKWSGTRYGGNTSKFITLWRTSATYNRPLTFGFRSGPTGSTSGSNTGSDYLSQFLSKYGYSTADTVTPQGADQFIAFLKEKGILNNPAFFDIIGVFTESQAEDIIRASIVGHKWSETPRIILGDAAGIGDTISGVTSPFQSALDIITTIGNHLLDLHLYAIPFGVLVAGYGFYLLTKEATAGEGGAGIVSAIPVIIREKA